MNVVFPDPFGPISPTISSASNRIDTSSTAVNPPNRLVNASVSSIWLHRSFQPGMGYIGSAVLTSSGATTSILS
jgi:hypothetical protein